MTAPLEEGTYTLSVVNLFGAVIRAGESGEVFRRTDRFSPGIVQNITVDVLSSSAEAPASSTDISVEPAPSESTDTSCQRDGSCGAGSCVAVLLLGVLLVQVPARLPRLALTPYCCTVVYGISGTALCLSIDASLRSPANLHRLRF